MSGLFHSLNAHSKAGDAGGGGHLLPEWIYASGCCLLLLTFVLVVGVAVMTTNRDRANIACRLAIALGTIAVLVLLR
ncbi:hypothetical protein [Tardiphaga sp. P9-11]|jgi:hypothetical protein|uniref:hypothetical protein n=1 Tax=Tardiphaga sp. P9-11 TaxID=2024614 RepID=UPI0011F22509|nr:hypothetical protein [Tardiphaga sp. P9-11]KAA0076438.1 hypothetical protein CIW50_09515 [Tardiphaga sp. P9-11]